MVTSTLAFRKIKRSCGFTLLEVLLVFALGSLVVGTVVFNLDNLIRAFSEKPWENLFYEAVQQARYQAVSQQAPCRMLLAPDGAHWVLTAADFKKEFPSGFSEETKAEFYPIEAVENYQGIGNAPAGKDPLHAVVIYPTGFMAPVEVHIILAGQSAAILYPDPCSSGPKVVSHE